MMMNMHDFYFTRDTKREQQDRIAHAEAVERAVRAAWDDRAFDEDMRAHEASEKKRKRNGGIAAAALSVACLGMFVVLALVWGKR